MSIIVRVSLTGRKQLGTLQIARTTNLGKGVLEPDAVSTYEVRLDDVATGTVEHRYGDGFWRLVAKASAHADRTLNG